MLTSQSNYYMEVGSYQSRILADIAKSQFPAKDGMGQAVVGDSILGDPNMPIGLFVPLDLTGRLRITVSPKTKGVIALEDITGRTEELVPS